MAEWQYDQAGITYDEPGLQYDALGTFASIKKYYTGAIALTKILLRRGIGF